MSKVTQTDIAKALGLSPSTVGLVVSYSKSPLRDRLSKETIQRVLDKADELGYVPNRAAQTMRKGRTNLIVLLNMSGYSEVGTKYAYKLGKQVVESGFEFQSIDAYWWPGDGKRLLEQVLALRPEGVIITGAQQTEMDYERLRKAGIPMVSISTPTEIPGFCAIRADTRKSFYHLTSACIASGHQRIALLIRDTENPIYDERRKGFLDALAQHGWPEPHLYQVNDPLPERALPEPAAFIFRNPGKPDRFNLFSAGYNCAAWFKTFADAVICTNDYYAIGALSWFQTNGVAVPQQVALSGFDNLTFSSLPNISLTTVEQPISTMSKAAVETLASLIRNPKQKPQTHLFPGSIIWRNSLPDCGRPAEKTDPTLTLSSH